MTFPLAHNTITEEDRVSFSLDTQVTMGPETAAFEREFAAYCGARHAIMVNSGSSADFVMMLAAVERGILRRNQEITMSAVTWPSQAWAALIAGLRIRFVDPDLNSLQARGADFQVHLFGNPDLTDSAELSDTHTPIFEDCCEALGARWDGKHVGTFGVAGAFSFFFSHHITTIEGGAIITNDDRFADMCRMIRAHGWLRDIQDVKFRDAFTMIFSDIDPRFLFIGPGLNFRPTEISARLGRRQLLRLDEMNAARAANFAALSEGRSNFPEFSTIRPNHRATPAWFAYPMILRDDINRRECAEYLASCGVETRPLMGGNLMRQPAFIGGHWSSRVRATTALPNADRIHRQGLYVGLPPFETEMRGLHQALGSMAVGQLV